MRRIQCACVHTYYYAAIVLVIALLTSGQDVDLCAKDSGCTCSESAPSVQPDDTVNHNGTAYEFFNTPATWCDAEQACRERSGNLASLLTVEENAVVADLCFRNLPTRPENATPPPDQGCWIGLNDRDLAGQQENESEKKFRWSDGSTAVPSYIDTMWHKGKYPQPDDRGQGTPEDCVFLYKGFPGWHDRDCAGLQMYICKILSPAAKQALEKARQPGSGTTGNTTTTQQQAPAPAPEKTTAAQLATIIGPTLSGLAGLMVAGYTGWKWYHKRKQTLVKLKSGTVSGESVQQQMAGVGSVPGKSVGEVV